MNDLDPRIVAIARDVRARGARALFVGGFVRDRLLGLPCKDIDVEIFGLELVQLKALLASHGEVVEVGRAFGVLRVKGLDVDFALPRSDSRPARDGADIVVKTDPQLTLEQAARRRDLTINSIALDPLTGEFLDPCKGRDDLAQRQLRATSPTHFVDDPLRGMRVAQLAARLEMQPDRELKALCRSLDLSRVAPQRQFEELRKLMLLARCPAIGLVALRECGLLRHFPEVEALIGVEQDETHHPEGDVWTHTLMAVDAAAQLRRGDDQDLVLMLAALCHDFGKPGTIERAGHRRAPEHTVKGAAIAVSFLTRLRAPNALSESVGALVEHHLAPSLLVSGGAGPKAYRTLARKLDGVGTNIDMLLRVARSDRLGRATEEARLGMFPAGDRFARNARKYGVEFSARPDAVLGRHLIARGFSPGPHFSDLLARCRDLQDETGREDPQWLLDTAVDRDDD